MADVFHIDGTIQAVPGPSDRGYTIAQVKALMGLDVGSPIQELPTAPGEALLMDENAKLMAQPPPFNLNATNYARSCGALMDGDYIVGPAMRVRCEDGKWI